MKIETTTYRCDVCDRLQDDESDPQVGPLHSWRTWKITRFRVDTGNHIPNSDRELHLCNACDEAAAVAFNIPPR